MTKIEYRILEHKKESGNNYVVAEVIPMGDGKFYCRKMFYPSWHFLMENTFCNGIKDVLSYSDLTNVE